MSNKLNRLFPEAAKTFQETPTETTIKNAVPILNIENIVSELERGDVPKELMFFRGGKNAQFRKKLEMFWLNDNIKKFVNYLESNECNELLKRNKMSINNEKFKIFFDNVNNGESILDFIAVNKTMVRSCSR